MWQIALLAIPFIVACNRNDSKPKPAESTPNPLEKYDVEDTCSTDSQIIENSYSEFGKLKQLLDGNKYSIRGSEIVVDSQGKDISEIVLQSSFPAGIHFSEPIQSSLNQLQGRDFYLCRKKDESKPVSVYRFANHYADLLIAKNLYAGLENDSGFKKSFPRDKVACSLKRTSISGSHDEIGRPAHDPNQVHNVIQKELECVDLNR